MAEVRIIYLPPGDGGKKQGVDDYLAAGHTMDELLAFSTTELRNPPRDESEDLTTNVPYRATASGLVWEKPTQSGPVPTPLTNFTARIVADVAEDDGAEVKRHFEVEARLGGRVRRFEVPAGKFHSMGWPTEHLGAGAIVFPGFGLKDHARAAIQMLSGEVSERKIFTHTGWREIDGIWVYLHGGGTIRAAAEASEGVQEVQLDDSLALYALPEPPEDENLRTAIRASLGLWGVAPEGITVSLHAATYRAIMGKSDFSLHVVGPTGEGKSELAALFQQHFGAGLDARHLTSWESTENALEAKAFALKDSLMVIDDFAPVGTSYDIQRLHKKADRIMRGKGNAQGRERMRADLSLRPPKPPKALVLSTGEDVPQGQSLRARMMILELGPGDIEWANLTVCQKDAREGRYAQAISGFLSWLSPRYEEVRRRMVEEGQELRQTASRGSEHKRTPGIVADLALGLRYFLTFAEDVGAITEAEAKELWERGWTALMGAAASQEGHQAAGEPAKRYLELLSAAISSGRAHIAATDGEWPEENAKALGWRKRTGGDYAEEWLPQGDRVGWVKGDELYLEPEASFRIVQNQAQGGDGLSVGARTLRKRLKEKGHLLSTDEKRQTHTVRRTIEGVKDRSVLHLRLSSLFCLTEIPDEPDDNSPAPFGHKASEPDSASGSGEHLAAEDEKSDASSGAGVVRRLVEGEPDAGETLTQAQETSERRVRRVLKVEGSEEAHVEASDASADPEHYELVCTPEQLEGLAVSIREAGVVAVDLETTGLNPREDRVRLISISTQGATWLVDCFEVDPAPLFPTLTDKKLVFHNAIFDLGFLVNMGFELGSGEVIDTMLMSQVSENEDSTKSEEAA